MLTSKFYCSTSSALIFGTFDPGLSGVEKVAFTFTNKNPKIGAVLHIVLKAVSGVVNTSILCTLMEKMQS